MNRTEYLVKNPKLIDRLGIRQGIPQRELDDFRQFVYLTSLENLDAYDPQKGSLSTYAGHFVKRRAIDYLRKLKRVPKSLADFETPDVKECYSYDDIDLD